MQLAVVGTGTGLGECRPRRPGGAHVRCRERRCASDAARGSGATLPLQVWVWSGLG